MTARLSTEAGAFTTRSSGEAYRGMAQYPNETHGATLAHACPLTGKHAPASVLSRLLIAWLLVGAIAAISYGGDSLFATVQQRYQHALDVRDHGEVIQAWHELNQLVDDVTLLQETAPQESHRWLAIIHGRQAAMLTYFSRAWLARCYDPTFLQPDDLEGQRNCRNWALCGRQGDALTHFALAQEECVAAGLRPSEYPCSQARGLAQRAQSKLRTCTKRMGR